VIGVVPQSVNTFLLRLDKKLPQWKPSDEVQAALDTVPKEFVSLSVSDPRPSVQSMLTLATTMGPAMLAGARQEIERMQRERGNAPPEGAAPQGNRLRNFPAELVMAPLFPMFVCVVNESGIPDPRRSSLRHRLESARCRWRRSAGCYRRCNRRARRPAHAVDE
jgi:hypothetical protein